MKPLIVFVYCHLLFIVINDLFYSELAVIVDAVKVDRYTHDLCQ